MTKEPFIAHSEITDEIYIVCGTEKYLVTEQVIKAMQNTGRLEQQPSEDCVSREKALLVLTGENLSIKSTDKLIALFDKRIKALPPVTPTHGTCKDCRHREGIDLDASFCAKHGNSARNDFYCADFEKRDSEDGEVC